MRYEGRAGKPIQLGNVILLRCENARTAQFNARDDCIILRPRIGLAPLCHVYIFDERGYDAGNADIQRSHK